MRIITWNCVGGEPEQRADELASFNADVIVLQECSPPSQPTETGVYFPGVNRKGVAVLAFPPYRIVPATLDPAVPDSVFPARIEGPRSFHLLAVWAQRRPTYVRAVLDGVQRYADFIRQAPTVIAGDFNSHPRWNERDKVNHTALEKSLRDSFGLASAYHASSTRPVGDEEATLYWRWQESQPFHVDYCFVPRAWTDQIRQVVVGNYADWRNLSDHRPLCVELAD
ncbi:MAG: endonuclease/exonuclease/phosphatase family protein [Pirellulaceae bacterium]|nr:endonuclease/exonuclease/phosphatase family protein [Pirellulaceae bacterium]